MNGYEKIANMIKNQSNTASNIFLTTMESANSCTVNNLPLDSDDLLVSDHLTDLKQGDLVVIVRLNDEKYAILERVV